MGLSWPANRCEYITSVPEHRSLVKIFSLIWKIMDYVTTIMDYVTGEWQEKEGREEDKCCSLWQSTCNITSMMAWHQNGTLSFRSHGKSRTLHRSNSNGATLHYLEPCLSALFSPFIQRGDSSVVVFMHNGLMVTADDTGLNRTSVSFIGGFTVYLIHKRNITSHLYLSVVNVIMPGAPNSIIFSR